MKAYTREAKFWRALALGQVDDLPEIINEKEYYMRLYALKLLGGVSSADSIPVEVPEAETDWLGKKTTELVENLQIFMDGNVAHVSGTAHYVTGFTEFNATVPEEQEGWYFPVKLDESGASTMTFTVNGEVTKKEIAYDPQVLFRVTDNETVVLIYLVVSIPVDENHVAGTIIMLSHAIGVKNIQSGSLCLL